MKYKRVDAPTKSVGGKRYLADWTVSLLPPRETYSIFVDAMCRSCAVLLAHDPANVSEVANDLDWKVSNFLHVLQKPHLFEQFKRQVETMPFSEIEFDVAAEKLRDHMPVTFGHSDDIKVAAALVYFTVARMSRTGNMQDFATLTKSRLRRGRNEQVSAWLTSIEKLPQVHARLMNVLILRRNVFDILPEFNRSDAIIYLDPPYILEAGARVTEGLYGDFDWRREDHERLLQALLQHNAARYLLAGYDTELYNRVLVKGAGWRVHKKEQPLHASGGAVKRRQVECVFTSYG